MQLSLLFFIFGFTLLVFGVSQQFVPKCSNKIDVKYVARNVYDDLLKSSPKVSSEKDI